MGQFLDFRGDVPHPDRRVMRRAGLAPGVDKGPAPMEKR